MTNNPSLRVLDPQFILLLGPVSLSSLLWYIQYDARYKWSGLLLGPWPHKSFFQQRNAVNLRMGFWEDFRFYAIVHKSLLCVAESVLRIRECGLTTQDCLEICSESNSSRSRKKTGPDLWRDQSLAFNIQGPAPISTMGSPPERSVYIAVRPFIFCLGGLVSRDKQGCLAFGDTSSSRVLLLQTYVLFIVELPVFYWRNHFCRLSRCGHVDVLRKRYHEYDVT